MPLDPTKRPNAGIDAAVAISAAAEATRSREAAKVYRDEAERFARHVDEVSSATEAAVADAVAQTGSDRVATASARAAAVVAANQAAGDRLAVANDRAATVAARDDAASLLDGLGSLDAAKAATREDAEKTAQDRLAAAVARSAAQQAAQEAAAARAQAALDKAAAEAAREQTDLDKAATAADRVQTGLDRAAAAGVAAGLIAARNEAVAAAGAATAAADEVAADASMVRQAARLDQTTFTTVAGQLVYQVEKDGKALDLRLGARIEEPDGRTLVEGQSYTITKEGWLSLTYEPDAGRQYVVTFMPRFTNEAAEASTIEAMVRAEAAAADALNSAPYIRTDYTDFMATPSLTVGAIYTSKDGKGRWSAVPAGSTDYDFVHPSGTLVKVLPAGSKWFAEAYGFKAGTAGIDTSANSAALQKAFDSTEAAGGGTVVLPAGVCDLNWTPLIGNHTVLEGAGAGTRLTTSRTSGSNAAVLANKRCDTVGGFGATKGIGFRNLTIDTPNTNGVMIAHAKGVFIENVWGADGALHHFFDMLAVQDLFAGSLWMGHSNASPFQIDGVPVGGAQNQFIKPDGTAGGALRDNTITDNLILDRFSARCHTYEGATGIQLHRTGYKNIILTNGVIDNYGSAIWMDGDADGENITITNITTNGCGQTIRMLGLPSNIRKNLNIGNITINNPVGDNDPVEIRLWNGVKVSNIRLYSDTSLMPSTGTGSKRAVHFFNCTNYSLDGLEINTSIEAAVRIATLSNTKATLKNIVINGDARCPIMIDGTITNADLEVDGLEVTGQIKPTVATLRAGVNSTVGAGTFGRISLKNLKMKLGAGTQPGSGVLITGVVNRLDLDKSSFEMLAGSRAALSVSNAQFVSVDGVDLSVAAGFNDIRVGWGGLVFGAVARVDVNNSQLVAAAGANIRLSRHDTEVAGETTAGKYTNTVIDGGHTGVMNGSGREIALDRVTFRNQSSKPTEVGVAPGSFVYSQYDTAPGGVTIIASGSGAYTLTPGTDNPDVFHTSTSGTAATITLSDIGAVAGRTRWRIVKVGPGTGSIDVGGLATLANGQWCEAVYDGSTYRLLQRGSLA